MFSILLQNHISKLFRYFLPTSRSVQVSASCKAAESAPLYWFFLSFKSNLVVKGISFMLDAAFAWVIPDLISHVHLASFVIMLPK
jgi:hypothetical protein